VIEPRRQSGFTLVEVLAAFVLLALVLSTSFQLFSTGLARSGDLEGYSRALVIAQSQLAQFGESETFEEGQSTGESEDRRYRWTVSISRYDAPVEGGTPPPAAVAQPGAELAPPYVLYRIAVRVAWQAASTRELALDLATLTVGRRV
jgi:general secretion pathway protein I